MKEDPPQYAFHAGLPTPEDIVERLRTLADACGKLGEDMEYIGGFGPMGKNGTRLLLVEHGMRRWAHEIEGAQG